MSFNKKFYRKLIAAVTALSMAFATVSCGESTSWIAKCQETSVNSGIYIFYQTEAYSEATSLLLAENSELDTSDTKLLKTMTVEGVNISDWINLKAQEQLKIFVGINQKFDELGLELSEDEISSAEYMAEYYWEYYADTYEKNGIGKDSFIQLVTFDYKKEKVFLYYYGDGGEKECSDTELSAYLEGNYSRVKTMKFDLADSDGNALEDADAAIVKAMAAEYTKRANSGENFDDLIDEYNEYLEEKAAEEAAAAEEAEAEESEETEADEETEVTTTVSEESEEPETTGTTTTAVTTAATEETDEGLSVESEEADEDKEESEITDEDKEESEETDEDKEESEETDEDREESEETEEDKEESEEADEDKEESEEADEEVSVESEETDEDTEEEEDPYANETVYKKGSEDNGYSPSETVNNAIFNDCKVNGDAVMVEDEENNCIYVIKRYDITEREDYYEGDTKENILFEMFNDEFENTAAQWADEYGMTLNTAAVKRYDPFNIKY